MDQQTSGDKPTGKPDMDLPEAPAPKRSYSRGGGLREALGFVGWVLCIVGLAVVLILYVFQSYQVDGPSMQQTLHNNDRLIVWKMSRTWSRITHHQYVPNRGDIIIFTQTGLAAYGQDNTKQLIKRVIGLPGDRVVVGDGKVTIYNREHPAGFQPDKTLPYGKNITEPVLQTGDWTLGPNQLFVCGDNRTNSLDSRFFGPINTDQVIGKLVVRVLPLSDAERF